MRWPRQREPLLDGIDLRLQAGRLASIGGENGVGKTTLLRVITGLIEPEAGTVSVRGLDPRRDRRDYQREIGFLPAGNSGLYARLTPRQHLHFWARIACIPRPEQRPRIDAILREFELEELAQRRVDRMSMGQRQRVRLAMVFLSRPAIVLLDEPRNSLDSSGLRMLSDALDAVRERGGTAIICSPTGEDVGVGVSDRYVLAERRLQPR